MSRSKLTSVDAIPSVIADLTLEEKLDLVGLKTAVHSLAIPDMDIPSISFVDGATGMNGGQVVISYATDPANHGKAGAEDVAASFFTLSKLYESEDLDAERANYEGNEFVLGLIDEIAAVRHNGKDCISFPSGINIGASFSPETAANVGRAVGQDMRDSGVDVCLGPNVDLARDPLGGRNYEMYGEDPTLVANQTYGYITGLQSAGTGACAKHYIANHQETNRNAKDTHVSIRTLRELYSRGFMAAVEADTASVMSAYNAINGTFSSYNKMILTDWLRTEWGFQGVVVSDWGAAKTEREKALLAGMDLMLDGGPCDLEDLKAAVEDGRLPMDVLDARVAEVLKAVVRVRDTHAAIPVHYDFEELKQAAYDAIVDGAVLLKNDGGVLPLPKDAKPGFFGTGTKELLECGSGSTAVDTRLHDGILSAYARKWNLDPETADGLFEKTEDTDTVIFTAVAPAGENMDRECMDVRDADRAALPVVLKAAKEAGKKTVVLLNVAGPVDVRAWEPYADAILAIFIPGYMGSAAAVDMLFGDADPAGRLPVTFPLRYEDTPSYPNFPGEFSNVYYGEGIFIGYRSYDKRDIAVKYPFGYGLSLTTFEAKADRTELTFDSLKEEAFVVPVTVTNTGSRRGSQVIQVYAAEAQPKVLRPVRELAGFAKVTLEPGETKTVNVLIRGKALQYFDDRLDKWVMPVGTLRLWLGTSSRDFFAEATVEVTGKNEYLLGVDSTFGDIMKNDAVFAVLANAMGGAMGASAGEGSIDKEMLTMVAHETVRNMLAPYLIKAVPDAVAANAILDQMDAAMKAVQ